MQEEDVEGDVERLSGDGGDEKRSTVWLPVGLLKSSVKKSREEKKEESEGESERKREGESCYGASESRQTGVAPVRPARLVSEREEREDFGAKRRAGQYDCTVLVVSNKFSDPLRRPIGAPLVLVPFCNAIALVAPRTFLVGRAPFKPPDPGASRLLPQSSHTPTAEISRPPRRSSEHTVNSYFVYSYRTTPPFGSISGKTTGHGMIQSFKYYRRP